jgi:hypothetical protein
VITGLDISIVSTGVALYHEGAIPFISLHGIKKVEGEKGTGSFEDLMKIAVRQTEALRELGVFDSRIVVQEIPPVVMSFAASLFGMGAYIYANLAKERVETVFVPSNKITSLLRIRKSDKKLTAKTAFKITNLNKIRVTDKGVTVKSPLRVSNDKTDALILLLYLLWNLGILKALPDELDSVRWVMQGKG